MPEKKFKIISFNETDQFIRIIGLSNEMNDIRRGIATDNCLQPFLRNDKVDESHLRRAESIWRKYLDGEESLLLIDLIHIENIFSKNLYGLKRILNKKFSVTKTLLTIRQRIGFGLHAYALELTWKNPNTHITSLKIARSYFRDAYGAEDSETSHSTAKECLGRLGCETTIISRWEKVKPDDLREAYNALKKSIDLGNSIDDALPYFLESASSYYDSTNNEDIFTEVDHFINYSKEIIPKVSLDLALFKSRKIQQNFKVIQVLLNIFNQNIHSETPEKIVKFAFLSGLILAYQDEVINQKDFVDISIPFGFRKNENVPYILIKSIDYIESFLVETVAKYGWNEPFSLSILGDIYLWKYDNREYAGNELEYIDKIIELYSNEAISDERSELILATYYLRKFKITNQNEIRKKSCRMLVDLVAKEQASPIAAIQLAKEVEANGKIYIECNSQEIQNLLSRGDSSGLWSLAAKTAMDNVNLQIYNLGGRSGVTSVGDYYGITQETLSYKNTYKSTTDYETERTKKLQQRIKILEIKKFGFSEILCTINDKNREELKHVAVRRFIKGASIEEILIESNHLKTETILSRISDFLAEINNIEFDPKSNKSGKAEAKREFRFWLKSFMPQDDASNVFETWWSYFEDLKRVEKRDSHIGNWIVGTDEYLFAIDLEAKGVRPVGYELAQITDDHNYLGPNDWSVRRAIFDKYIDTLDFVENGVDELYWKGYQASVLARNVRKLTSQEMPQISSLDKERRFRDLLTSIPDEDIKRLGQQIIEFYLKKRNISKIDVNEKKVSGVNRIRNSKAIAKLLRHSKILKFDEYGWVSIEDLASSLTGLTVDEISLIATDAREPRFEVDDGKIRAKYGHTNINIKPIEHNKKNSSNYLFHATPWSNGYSIIDNMKGLDKRSRQYVHLTSSRFDSIINGKRNGHPLILEVTADDTLNAKRVSETTYLATNIGLEQLSVVPIISYWEIVPTVRIH